MCIRDSLFTGEGAVYKLGAAPTYVRRGSSVRRIAGSSLPAGLAPSEHAVPDHTRLRLEAAMLLLRQSDTTLTDAAYACGFSNPKYLNRSFQKNLGMSPRQWLQENRPDPSRAPSAEDPRTAQRILTPDECRALLDALEIP